MKKPIYAALAVTALCGCTASTSPEITKIRSLSAPIVVSEAADRSGQIAGLERSARSGNGAMEANVLIVHGMGWSQQSRVDQVGFDFVQAIEAAYGVQGTLERMGPLCPQSRGSAAGPQPGTKPAAAGGLHITIDAASLQTDSPVTSVNNAALACLDKVSVELGSQGRVTIYRLFWDDNFYNGYEYPHLGYDDSIFLGHEQGTAERSGYEDINALRASLNARLKTNFVTYGFSDATMYLGPVGERVRRAVAGGICAVVNDLTGQTRLFEGSSGGAAQQVSSDQLCAVSTSAVAKPLTLVTHSLGSRVVFDVLTGDRTGPLASKLNGIANEELEVFMLANQIPLLGVGKVAQRRNSPAPMAKKLKFIAVSEINDILSYEIVPYFEHMYFLGCDRTATAATDHLRACTAENLPKRMDYFRSSAAARQDFVDQLGFDVIDVRASFAANVIPFVPFAHPWVAHTGHMGAKPVRDLLLCGADSGVLRRTACAAR